MSYRQLLYHSRATRDMTDADLKELLEESRRLNKEHGVTGLLLYVSGLFMQCIEGGQAEIGQLAENIRRDDRNMEFTVLFDRSVAERAFPAWSMGFHAMSVEDLRAEEGFRDIRHAEDLAQVEHRDRMVFDMMQHFYAANAPFGG